MRSARSGVPCCRKVADRHFLIQINCSNRARRYCDSTRRFTPREVNAYECDSSKRAECSVGLLQECPALQLIKRLAQFRLRVHDDGAVPGDRFLERLSGHEQEPDAVCAGVHHDVVATVEEDERAVVDFGWRRGMLPPSDAFGRYGKGLGRVTELSGSAEHIREGMTRRFDRQRLLLTGW